VGIGSAFRTGAATYNGEEAVLGAALMLAERTAASSPRPCDAKLKEIQPKLPAGVIIPGL
jgi:cobalt-zinc-cadmium resistance protein CzcA